MSGLQVVSVISDVFDGLLSYADDAPCPNGKVAIGGGYELIGNSSVGGGALMPIQSVPTGSPTAPSGWLVQARFSDLAEGGGVLRMYAICASVGP